MSKNRILSALPRGDADWFLPKLEKVELNARTQSLSAMSGNYRRAAELA
jgi:hypothetical protein